MFGTRHLARRLRRGRGIAVVCVAIAMGGFVLSQSQALPTSKEAQIDRMGELFEAKLLKAGLAPEVAAARTLLLKSIIAPALEQPLPPEKMQAVEESLAKRPILPYGDLSALETELAGAYLRAYLEDLAARPELTAKEQRRLAAQREKYIETARAAMMAELPPEEQAVIPTLLKYFDKLLARDWDDPLQPVGKYPLPEKDVKEITDGLRERIAIDAAQHREFVLRMRNGPMAIPESDLSGPEVYIVGTINHYVYKIRTKYFTPPRLEEDKMETISRERQGWMKGRTTVTLTLEELVDQM